MVERDFKRAEATVEAQKVVDKAILKDFVLVSDPTSVEEYAKKKKTFAAFSLKASSEVISELLQIGLKRAVDQTDPAFCFHASQGHVPFNEVVSDLSSGLEEGKVKASIVPIDLGVDTKKGSQLVQAKRLILTGEERVRRTFRPGPLQLALEAESFLNEKSINKRESREKAMAKILKNVAAEYGIPFAILTGFYMKFETHELVKILTNNNVKGFIAKERKLKGATARFPNSMSDYKIMGEIRRQVVVKEKERIRPNFDKNSYFNGLALFRQDYERDFSPELKVFCENDDLVTAKAVFACLDEIAQKNAPEDFLEPARTEYIDRTFGKFGTTKMITAYFEFALDIGKYKFEEVIKR